MKRLLALGLLVGAIFCARPLFAADTDTIDSVSDDGSHIIMQSGHTYESDDPCTSTSWHSGDDVVITNNDTIVNKDEGGETVNGTLE